MVISGVGIMKWLALVTAVLCSVVILGNNTFSAPFNELKPYKVPEFTHTKTEEWINSRPLTVNDLKGTVFLIDMWTFDCWNCYRSFPWLNALEKKYSNSSFQIIGVHSPEFDHEKIPTNIKAKVKEFKLHHPVMIDNDFSYWRALNNRYWPTFYLVDKSGDVVYRHVGETHEGDRKALALEKKLQELLKP